jgi:preprotein translocase SecE subunit
VNGRGQRDDAPAPISHAAPDVELAEAQLAEREAEPGAGAEVEAEAGPGAEAELESEAERGAGAEREAEAELAGDFGKPSNNARAVGEELDSDDEEFGEGPQVPGVFPGRARVESGELEPSETRAPEARVHTGNRLINFLQGSWRELQRVQWPDRRQVMQATGVVIGFVIVAGLFLGVADALAGKLVDYILK